MDEIRREVFGDESIVGDAPYEVSKKNDKSSSNNDEDEN